jgi:hypothetical protein
MFLRILAVLIAVCFGYASAHQFNSAIKDCQTISQHTEKWPLVKATITEVKEFEAWCTNKGRNSVTTKVVEIPFSPNSASPKADGYLITRHVTLKYRYVVDNQTHQNSRISRFGPTIPIDEALRLKVTLGGPILIHYNPEKPQEASVFVTDTTWLGVISTTLEALFFLAIASLILYLALTSEKKNLAGLPSFKRPFFQVATSMSLILIAGGIYDSFMQPVSININSILMHDK